MRYLYCAQRLSASQRWAHREKRLLVTLQGVLNAFRHHRGGHIALPHFTHTGALVLNAFRHHRGGHRPARPSKAPESSAQRLSASQRWAPDDSGEPYDFLGCSTPFGITEVGTTSAVVKLALGSLCSTPFGITEVGTCPITKLAAPVARCSTPFGITEVGTCDVQVLRAAGFVCSTPFGITEVGTSPWPARQARRQCSAQRLSASQRWARGRVGQKLVGHEGVLNAFRHHRGGHSSKLGLRFDFSVCSTPFGITEVGTYSGTGCAQ